MGLDGWTRQGPKAPNTSVCQGFSLHLNSSFTCSTNTYLLAPKYEEGKDRSWGWRGEYNAVSTAFMEPASSSPPHILCAQTAGHEPGQPQARRPSPGLTPLPGPAAASPIIFLHLANSTPSAGAQIESLFLCHFGCSGRSRPWGCAMVKPTSEGLVILHLEALLPTNL